MNSEPVSDRYYSSVEFRWRIWFFVKYHCRWLRLLPFWRWLLYGPLMLLLFCVLLLLRFLMILDRIYCHLLKPRRGRLTIEPDYGVKVSDSLTTIPLEQIPAYPRAELKEHLYEAEICGFRLCHCYRLETIGDAEGFEVYLMDRSGTICLVIHWFAQWKKKKKRNEQHTWLYGMSILQNGARHISSTDASKYLMPEMRLPDEEAHYDPEVNSIEDLLRLHRENLPPDAKLEKFDCESLAQRVRDRAALQIQTFLNRKISFELTPQEIEKLKEKDAERERSA